MYNRDLGVTRVLEVHWIEPRSKQDQKYLVPGMPLTSLHGLSLAASCSLKTHWTCEGTHKARSIQQTRQKYCLGSLRTERRWNILFVPLRAAVLNAAVNWVCLYPTQIHVEIWSSVEECWEVVGPWRVNEFISNWKEFPKSMLHEVIYSPSSPSCMCFCNMCFPSCERLLWRNTAHGPCQNPCRCWQYPRSIQNLDSK